ncbi:MAG: glycosyltransferase family 2 protein [Mucilaginibacter sp.]|nr:glycosyltransferase family 2 protein [Mucilaginibacter sp.]
MKDQALSNVAVLLTCYNRKYKTLTFLHSLIDQFGFKRLQADIYLLDDGSTDGTAAAVKKEFPFVNIINGTGSLFWAGGMLTIWKYAITQKVYDLFLLFNDDVILLEDSVERLMATYMEGKSNGTILIGSTLSPVSNQLSYGGSSLYKSNRAAYYSVKPHDSETLPCQLGNANILLVDKFTVERIGLFSNMYTHYLADFDYTLTAFRNGVDVLIAPGYYGYCEDDHGVNWLSGKHSLKKRISYLYSVNGLAYKEYLYYIKKHFPADYISAFAKLWLKTLFPIIWDKFKRREMHN